MITLRRIYLYTILAVLLAALLIGVSDLLEVLFDGLAESAGARSTVYAGETREDLSLALALIIVAAPLWAFHAWLLRHSTHGDPEATRDERASGVRSSYFLGVLLITLAVASVTLVGWLDMALRGSSVDGPFEPSTALAYGLSFGVAWALHAWWRMRDLRLAPVATAGDWLTRVTLYVVLFVAGTVTLVSASDLVTTAARFLVEGHSITSATGWLRGTLASPLAWSVVAATAWSVHWLGGRRLCRAPDPMGAAHRSSRMRAAYFVAVALVSAVAVLSMASDSLRQIALDIAAIRWRDADPDRLKVIGGPLLASVPFLAAWWWHLRRAAHEASAWGGGAVHAAVSRVGRLAVALVGLIGLALGSATTIGAVLDLGSTYADANVISATILRRDLAGAASMAIVGLAIWLPSWVLVQRERARDVVRIASSTARRAYLGLVGGLAVVAAMISGAWVAYQAIRYLLDTGDTEGTSLALGFLIVAVTGLAYHLWVLRADLRLAPVAHPSEVLAPAMSTVAAIASSEHAVEELEVSGPPDADFESVNTALREHLPEGFELRIVETHKT